MQNLLIIPGLGDDVRYTKFLTGNWEKKYNIKSHVVAFGWWGDSNKFNERFEKMKKYLDDFIEKNENVSILGISAGGSAAINLFSQKKDKLRYAVIVCGRLHDSNLRSMWYLRKKDLGVFEESIKLCEKNIDQLSEGDKKRILTIRPLYDEIVPVRTMTIKGAENKRINSVQHMVSISLALTLYSGIIAKFLKS